MHSSFASLGRLAAGGLAALAFSAFALQAAAQAPAPSAPRIAVGPVAPPIHFELYNNRVYLPVRVNGSDPLWFVLDSGASVTGVDVRRAASLRLAPKGSAVDGHNGAGEGSFAMMPLEDVTFALPGVAWTGRDVFTIPFDSMTPFEGRPVEGVLGYDFFRRYVVEVDYPARTLTLYDPKLYQYSGSGAAIPVDFDGNWISTRVTVQPEQGSPIDCDIVIDSGARGALAFNSPFVGRHRLLETTPTTFPGIRYGVGGEAPQLMGRVRSLRVGPFTIEEPITGFSTAIRGATSRGNEAGTISGDILRRFKVTFDYARKRMIWEQPADLDRAFDYDASGLSLTVEGTDLKTVRVHRVFERSPAADAGVRDGDVIVSIDGTPAERFTLEEIERLLRRQGRDHVLRVRRGDATAEVALKTRKLV